MCCEAIELDKTGDDSWNFILEDLISDMNNLYNLIVPFISRQRGYHLLCLWFNIVIDGFNK